MEQKEHGRPRKQFSKNQIDRVEECAFMGCKVDTIALLTGIAESNLRDNFQTLIDQKRAERRLFLRTHQFEQVKNNPVMVIFLGKADDFRSIIGYTVVGPVLPARSERR